MANMSMTKNPMPTQEPLVRARNFDEVATGYTEEQVKDEAARCLQCRYPRCREGCPVSLNIPAFIRAAGEGDFDEAYRIISIDSSLPAVCGRVCPQENQCEKYCARGIKGESVAIGRIERFVADRHNEKPLENVQKPEPNGYKVAVVGSGPAGLTCAGDLAKRGYAVTVYEALHLPGGVMSYGIPEFRLPKAIVAREIEGLKALGVEILTDMVVGKVIDVNELREEYDAVFIGSGAGLPMFMHIPGENLKGVYSANEFLTRINLMKAYQEGSHTPIKRPKRAAVVGGGNVAMDAARCALRLGAEEVSIVYRRGMEELPARKEEVEHAQEEGIVFRTLRNPVEIEGDPKVGVSKMKCQVMELGEPDERGRRKPVPVEGQFEELDVDVVIMALGTNPNPLIRKTTEGLEFTPKGGIQADEATGQTSLENVFSGGDAVTGAATVILAMGAGKKSAAAIDEYLRGSKGK